MRPHAGESRWSRLRHVMRRTVVAATRAMPRVPGEGRIVLALDKLLTDPNDPASFTVVGQVNNQGLMEFDLRAWGQKFAYYYGDWERDLVDVVLGLYRGGTFIDVGASIGLYAASCGQEVRKRKGRMVAVEPVPWLRRKLERTIHMNRLHDAVCVRGHALGAMSKKVAIYSDPQGADNNAFLSPEGADTVDMMRLDDMMTALEPLPPVGFIKMDVEGYEPEVIEGARETITRHLPPILAEFNRERMAIMGMRMEPSLAFLARLGYAPFMLRGGRLTRLSSVSQEENLFLLPTGGPWAEA